MVGDFENVKINKIDMILFMQDLDLVCDLPKWVMPKLFELTGLTEKDLEY